MARNMAATTTLRERPSLPSVKSFTRFEPSEHPKSLHERANTLKATGEAKGDLPNTTILSTTSPDRVCQFSPDDIFDQTSQISPIPPLDQSVARAQSLPARFDELPVELASLTDR